MRFKVAEYINKSLGGIRLEGNTVQCVRLTQEINPKGRRIERIITTLDRWAPELPSEAKALLTEKECAQWIEWKVKHDTEYRRRQLAIALNAATGTITAAATALRDDAGDVSDPESLWEAIDYLAAELVRAGYEKPKKPRGRPTKLIEDEDDGPATWPLGNTTPLPNFAPPGTDAHRQYQALLDTYESFRRATEKAKEA
jgi:hypothetical protein